MILKLLEIIGCILLGGVGLILAVLVAFVVAYIAKSCAAEFRKGGKR